MFNENNRIIIVDDEESQLLELAKVFLFNGVSCKTILYNQTYDKPLNGVRIAFFDILPSLNYSEIPKSLPCCISR